jgi:hypothetical protein
MIVPLFAHHQSSYRDIRRWDAEKEGGTIIMPLG